MPLEMSPDQMRQLGYGVIDMLVDRSVNLASQPVWNGASRAALDALLSEPAPAGPTDFHDVLKRLRRDVLPYAAAIDHPRFLAFIPTVPTWPGVLGDLIASGADIFQGTWLASSGVSALELTVIDWFSQWLGFGRNAAGLLVSGGSAANLTALACARISRFGAHDNRAVLYCSTEAHSSVNRAAHILGFSADRIVVISDDGAERMDAGLLESRMQQDRGDGLLPFAVVANAGTTSTGAIDPLHAIADICARLGAWLHIDAAYGGFAVLTERGRTLLDGIERADSIALDPHKWLYQPFECGCLIVRDGALLERAFHVMPPYLQDTALPEPAAATQDETQALPVNFCNRGIQLTRSARVLKIWLSIQTFGLDAFRDAIDQSLDLTNYADERIRASQKLEIMSPAQLGIVCFRRRCDGNDHANSTILRALLDSGIAMISSTRIRGAFALRFCVLNYRTSRQDIDDVLDWIENYPL